MPIQPGDMIGQYRVEAQVGSGGMATVYKAYHAKLDRYVAIKMMHQTLLSDEAFHARFEREARIVAKLEHPNIVPIFDFSEHENNPYLVMKHVEGRTLKNLLKQGALSLDEVRRIMTAVANALDYAHRQGVLHRDVKPSNIILDESGTPYLTDFGLARIAQAGESTMSADMMLGTPHYIAPEQAKGEKNIDGRADLYSLAVILYELLVGRVPFSADTAYATVHDHIYTPPPSPSSLNPEITPEVEEVLLKALSKDRQDRYATAGEMVRAFEQAANMSGLDALDPARAERVPPVASTIQHRPIQPPPIPPIPVENPLQFTGQVLNEAFKQAQRNISESKRERRKNTMEWLPGTKWGQDAEGTWGFFSPEELQQVEASISEEDRIRMRVAKQMKARKEFFGHLTSYVMVNLMFWGIWLMTGSAGTYPWPIWITFGWGIGMAVHTIRFITENSGRDRMEEAVQREIERELERERRKLKHDDYDPSVAIRLTEDGELTDTYIEQAKGKRKQR